MNGPSARSDAEMLEINLGFYESLWRDAQLVRPQRFNTWPLIEALARKAPRRLEVAPGLRPRLPLEQTEFLDISQAALAKLAAAGARTSLGQISALPWPDQNFDLLCALDIIEHVDDDEGALAELARVAADGAVLLMSVPLHPSLWTPFDDMVGHRRRYEPEPLRRQLHTHGFAVEQTAIFGMKPKSNWLTALGMWFLSHDRQRSMRIYNRFLMPLGVYFQKPLALLPGFVADRDVADVLLVCRKHPHPAIAAD